MLDMKYNPKNFTVNLVKVAQLTYILNYEMINDDILRAKNKHMPCKLVKFNKYKHKKSAWITLGLLKSIRYRDKLYKQLRLSNPNSLHYDTLKLNLKTYNLILKMKLKVKIENGHCE